LIFRNICFLKYPPDSSLINQEDKFEISDKMPQTASAKKKFNTLVTIVRTIEPSKAGKKPAT
jgi:hypothetical protein